MSTTTTKKSSTGAPRASSKTTAKPPKDFFTDALLLGFGLVDITREKVEQFIEEVKRDRNISKEESRKAVNDAMARIKKGKKEIEKVVRPYVKKIVAEVQQAIDRKRGKPKVRATKARS